MHMYFSSTHMIINFLLSFSEEVNYLYFFTRTLLKDKYGEIVDETCLFVNPYPADRDHSPIKQLKSGWDAE